MKLEYGKQYVTRNGIITPPLAKTNHVNYKFEAWIQEPEYPEGDLSCAAWLDGGWSLIPNYEHRLDLIEEYDPNEH
jgi:hypothetical protein